MKVFSSRPHFSGVVFPRPKPGEVKVVADMACRHQSVATLVALTIDGLDRPASGQGPLAPIRFILSALGLVEILKGNLDRGELPLAASKLTEGLRHAL